MRRARFLTSYGFVLATAAFTLSGNTSENASSMIGADSIAVARVVADFHKALAAADSATALRLLAADATILESGYFESRSEYRSHHLAEDIEFARAVASKRAPLQIRVQG